MTAGLPNSAATARRSPSTAGRGPHDQETSPMPIGTVKWFNTTKGYGFIAAEDGSKGRVRSHLRRTGRSRHASRKAASQLRTAARARRQIRRRESLLCRLKLPRSCSTAPGHEDGTKCDGRAHTAGSSFSPPLRSRAPQAQARLCRTGEPRSRRIASSKMLPWPKALPHLKCSPKWNTSRSIGHEEDEHDGAGRVGQRVGETVRGRHPRGEDPDPG